MKGRPQPRRLSANEDRGRASHQPNGRSPRLNLLMSRPYITPDVVRAMIEHQDHLNLLVDCGAVTAWNRGETVSLDDYCRFLSALPVKPWGIIALDKMGDAEETLKNYATMKDRGFDPIPVITRKAPREHVDYYCDRAPMVAGGGLASAKGQSPLPRAMQVMGQVAGRKPVHLLGFTSIRYIAAARPYSVDSSSWESAARYGAMDVYVGGGRMLKVTRKEMLTRPSDEVCGSIRRYGFNPLDLARDAAWRGGNSVTRGVSASSWVNLAREMEAKIGTRLFLAAANLPAMMACVRGHLYQTQGREL